MASRHSAAVLTAIADRRSTVRQKGPKEAAIQCAVVKHLQSRAVAGVVWFHVPNGGSRNRIEAAKLVGAGVVSGVPDLVLIANGRAYGLELKAVGGRVSPAQQEMHRRWERAGGVVAVAVGLDAALSTLEAWGLLRMAARAA
jgi:hypothetical protein